MKFSTRRKYKKNGLRKKTYRKYKKGGRESRKRSPSVPISKNPSRIPISRTTTRVQPHPQNGTLSQIRNRTIPRTNTNTRQTNNIVTRQANDTQALLDMTA